MHLTKAQVRLLWLKARDAGFSKQGLRRMINHVGLRIETMTADQLDTLTMYVNSVNAKKFSYEGETYEGVVPK